MATNTCQKCGHLREQHTGKQGGAGDRSCPVHDPQHGTCGCHGFVSHGCNLDVRSTWFLWDRGGRCVARYAPLLLLLVGLYGCAPMLPTARPTTPPVGAQDYAQAAWEGLGGEGYAPKITFFERECDRGFWDQNGRGCVTGEVVFQADVVYVAKLSGWRETVRHELQHVLHPSKYGTHEDPKLWVRCGDGWCAR